VDLSSSSLWAWAALAALVAFVIGSLPFATWLGRLVARQDVRSVGDGNPGATNVFRAGGVALGLAVLLLDVSKGVLPVALAKEGFGLEGWALAWVAVMPVAGTAFSPFLGFRGGKALAVTLGTWIGLTIWTIPLVAIVAIVGAALLIDTRGWAVATALTAMLLGLLLWVPSGWSVVALLLQAAIILWKHRSNPARPPRARRLRTRPT
jgi:acyl phosphate:glycerol-3-phosphate acyltransferase